MKKVLLLAWVFAACGSPTASPEEVFSQSQSAALPHACDPHVDSASWYINAAGVAVDPYAPGAPYYSPGAAAPWPVPACAGGTIVLGGTPFCACSACSQVVTTDPANGYLFDCAGKPSVEFWPNEETKCSSLPAPAYPTGECPQ